MTKGRDKSFGSSAQGTINHKRMDIYERDGVVDPYSLFAVSPVLVK